MKKIIAVIEYDGTRYHGWQLQNDLLTVQGSLELSLERILGRATRVYGAGRTDAGVHAIGQVAHFSSDWSRSLGELHRGWNALLPDDISVRRLASVPEDFHARHSARSKTYSYRILNQPLRSPLLRYYCWHVPQALKLPSMEAASASLLGVHDFAAFGSPTDGTPSTVREILDVRWNRDESEGILTFSVRGTGFLRHMIRSLVGTLVRVGRGRMSVSDVSRILESCDRSQAGPTAPAHGLCLDSVDYPELNGATWSSGDAATRSRAGLVRS
jgi:tRNA pseudouridine38-40 synthase